MDKVRFGRALGKGARSAAKSLWEAADAATSPDPASKSGATAPTRPPRAAGFQEAVGSVVQAHRAVTQTKQQARNAGMTAIAPVVANAKRLSGVLWLELTGTFFSLFALFLGGAVWKSRGALRNGASTPEAHKLFFYFAVFAVFAYFAISSFVRARQRERR